jgi:hypothetical protein
MPLYCDANDELIIIASGCAHDFAFACINCSYIVHEV